MANGQTDPLEAANQVIVLAFDLVDRTLPQTPEMILKALESPPVRKAIEKTLLDFAQSRRASTTTQVSDDEARELLDALRSGVQGPMTDAVLAQIEKSPQYKRLKASVVAFKKAAESSSLGVWVDKHKGILYVIGAALVVGTGTVLYTTRSGGPAVRTAVDALKGKKFEVLQIGSLTFGAALLDFQPDARVLGARVTTLQKWEKVSVELSLGMLASGSNVDEVQGAALVKSGPFAVNVTGTAKPQSQSVNLGLKLEYSGVFDSGTFNIGLGAMYQDQQPNATLNAALKSGGTSIGLQGNVGSKDGGVQYGGMLTLSVDL